MFSAILKKDTATKVDTTDIYTLLATPTGNITDEQLTKVKALIEQVHALPKSEGKTEYIDSCVALSLYVMYNSEDEFNADAFTHAINILFPDKEVESIINALQLHNIIANASYTELPELYEQVKAFDANTSDWKMIALFPMKRTLDFALNSCDYKIVKTIVEELAVVVTGLDATTKDGMVELYNEFGNAVRG